MSATTAGLEADALTVPCPEHQVSEGTECPRPATGGGEQASIACMTRRSLASARAALAGFPRGGDLDRLNWRQMRELAEQMRSAAQDASNCVDTALAPFGV